MVKVTFIAKEPGLYKIVLSNEHSWYRAKTLQVRYVVLEPVVEPIPVNLPPAPIAAVRAEEAAKQSAEASKAEKPGDVKEESENKADIKVELIDKP